ncbi:MAG: glycosyltransferase family 2 protein [bacterium]|nr:glycosyltransferase family 2 protein [bacterium]
MRDLVFVIINYNTKALAEKLVANVKDYQSISKILIVDNASTDDSYQELKKLENDRIEVIQAKENKGFSAGMNIGAKRAIELFSKCDIIFSNTDIIISSEETIEILQTALKMRRVAVASPVVFQENTISRGWKIPSAKEEVLINLPGIGKKFQKKYMFYDEDHYKGKYSYVEAVSGCFFMIKSEALKRVNYFDENVFLYYEENILGEKLRNSSYTLVICNEALIIHDHSVSIDHNVGTINKFKILKTSQRYFQKKYHYATEKEIRKLKFTSNLTLMTIYIRVFLKGGFKK